MQNTTHSWLVKWSLIVGIIIVLNLFFNYALSLVYESPEYESFCPQEQVVVMPGTQEACVIAGGQWNGTTAPQYESGYYDAEGRPVMQKGYCDVSFTCRQEFTDANDAYQRNVFITLVVLGVVTLLGALIFKTNTVLSIALAWGGVLSLVIASIRYWSSADNLIKVVMLAVALIALIGVAVQKFRD